MNVEEVIINLKVLEKLDKNQKLVTRQSYLNIEPSSLFIPEFVRRWHYRESRNETLKKINKVINKAIFFLNDNKNDPLQNSNLLDSLRKSMVGIYNLKQTYSICTQTCARLDMIIDKIKSILELQERRQ